MRARIAARAPPRAGAERSAPALLLRAALPPAAPGLPCACRARLGSALRGSAGLAGGGRRSRPGQLTGGRQGDVCERERPGVPRPSPPRPAAMSLSGGPGPGPADAPRLRPRAARMARRPELLCGAAIVLGCAFLVALKVTCR